MNKLPHAVVLAALLVGAPLATAQDLPPLPPPAGPAPDPEVFLLAGDVRVELLRPLDRYVYRVWVPALAVAESGAGETAAQDESREAEQDASDLSPTRLPTEDRYYVNFFFANDHTYSHRTLQPSPGADGLVSVMFYDYQLSRGEHGSGDPIGVALSRGQPAESAADDALVSNIFWIEWREPASMLTRGAERVAVVNLEGTSSPPVPEQVEELYATVSPEPAGLAPAANGAGPIPEPRLPPADDRPPAEPAPAPADEPSDLPSPDEPAVDEEDLPPPPAQQQDAAAIGEPLDDEDIDLLLAVADSIGGVLPLESLLPDEMPLPDFERLSPAEAIDAFRAEWDAVLSPEGIAAQIADDPLLATAVADHDLTPEEFGGLVLATSFAVMRAQSSPDVDMAAIASGARDDLRAELDAVADLEPEEQDTALLRLTGNAMIFELASRLEQVPEENVTLVEGRLEELLEALPPELTESPLESF